MQRQLAAADERAAMGNGNINARFGTDVGRKMPSMSYHTDTGLWVRVTMQDTAVEYWLWRPGVQLPTTKLKPSQLQEEGWQQVEHERYFHQSICLWGQLSDAQLIQREEGTPLELWTRPIDLVNVEAVPVALVFTLPTTIQEEMDEALAAADAPDLLLVTIDLPPPQLGESALIAVADGWQQYSIGQLKEEAQQLQQQIGEALRSLAAPADWWLYTDLLATCSQTGRYEMKRQELRSTLLTTKGRIHDQVQEQLLALDVARSRAENIQVARQRAAQDPQQWFSQYQHVQQMVKELAALYWQMHQSTQRPGRRLPQINNVFLTGSRTQIPSSLPIQAVLAAYSNAASGGNQWQQPTPDHPPTFQFDRPSGTTSLEVRPSGGETVLSDSTIRSLWEQVRQFSDLDGDAFLAALAQAMAAPPDEEGYVWITSAQVLDYRGIRPIMKREGAITRRAGHRQEDMAGVAACFGRMSNTWVTIRQMIEEQRGSKRKRASKRLYTHQSRLMQIAEVIQQRELNTDQTAPAPNASSIAIAWRYQPGTWLKPFLEAPNRQMTWLFQQVLRYDPHNEQWEKRLARYFMFHLRINSAGSGASIVWFDWIIGATAPVALGAEEPQTRCSLRRRTCGSGS